MPVSEAPAIHYRLHTAFQLFQRKGCKTFKRRGIESTECQRNTVMLVSKIMVWRRSSDLPANLDVLVRAQRASFNLTFELHRSSIFHQPTCLSMLATSQLTQESYHHDRRMIRFAFL